MEYRHGLSRPLVDAMAKLYARHGRGAVNLKILDLTRNQWDNFQKLRYWGLVEKGKHAGEWRVTELGEVFLIRGAKVRRSVWTYRGVRQRFDGDLVTVHSELGRRLGMRADYAETAQPGPPPFKLEG
jgi:hypothetical protein